MNKNVFKFSGGASVIRDTFLDVGNDAFCAFVDPSGYCRSTLVRVVLDLEDITDDRVEIGKGVLPA